MPQQYGFPYQPNDMHQQHFAMMSQQPEGGIIADDLRNLRSMTDGADLDMAGGGGEDAQMMDAGGYVTPQQDMPGAPYGLQSPPPGDDGMGLPEQEQQHAFGSYDGRTY